MNDKTIVSETMALARIRSALQEIAERATLLISGTRRFEILDLIREADGFAETLQAQAGRGLHRNPPLVIFGNPPLVPGRRLSGRFNEGERGQFRFTGQMSRDVHEVRYTHLDDSKSYKHLFDSGDVEMYAIMRGHDHRDVLLTGGSGQPLWKDFD